MNHILPTLKAIWDFVDGNKTKIGAALGFIGRLVTQLGHPEFGNPISEIGDVLMGVGLVHTVAKSDTALSIVRAAADAMEPVVIPNSPPELRQIVASADIFKPGMTVRGFDGKTQIVKRLLRGGGKGADGGTEYVYEVEVK